MRIAHTPHSSRTAKTEAEHDGGNGRGREAAVGLEGGDLIGGRRHGDGASVVRSAAAGVVAREGHGIAAGRCGDEVLHAGADALQIGNAQPGVVEVVAGVFLWRSVGGLLGQAVDQLDLANQRGEFSRSSAPSEAMAGRTAETMNVSTSGSTAVARGHVPMRRRVCSIAIP